MACGALIALGALAAWTASPTEASAAGSAAFLAVANADGTRVSVTARGYLVVENFADVGLPSAQALTSSIDNTGYAGLPWPGADVLGLQGTVNGAVGQPVADYPAAVQSDATTPKVEKSSQVFTLRAVTTDTGSSGFASGGLASSGASVAHAETAASTSHDSAGTATAASNSHAEGIDIAGVLRIGVVAAKASVTAKIDGTRKRDSSLSVSDVRVVGQAVGFTDKGITVAGSNTPLPKDNPLTVVLADQGITVEYLAAEATKEGVLSAGMRVSVVRPVPSLPHPVEVSYLFGRAFAAATGGGAVGIVPTETGAPTTTPTVEPQPGSGGNPGVTTPVVPGTAPVAASGLTPTAQPTATAAPQIHTQSVAGPPAMRADPATFYLVLVLGGVLLIGGAQLLRLFGVKVLWNA